MKLYDLGNIEYNKKNTSDIFYKNFFDIEGKHNKRTHGFYVQVFMFMFVVHTAMCSCTSKEVVVE